MKRSVPRCTSDLSFEWQWSIRKFQRFESDKFKKSIECTFDKKAALDELKALYGKDNAFPAQGICQARVLCAQIRVDSETIYRSIAKLLSQLSQNLNDGIHSTNANWSEKKFLPVYVVEIFGTQQRMGCRNWSLDHLDNSTDPKLLQCFPSNRKLILVLAHLIAKSHKNAQQRTEYWTCRSGAGSSRGQPGSEGFFSSINWRVTNQSIAIYWMLPEVLKAAMWPNSNHSRRAEAWRKTNRWSPRTIQAVKSKTNNKKSEETDFKFLDLSECMKNRNRKLNSNMVIEQLETIDDKSGDDRSMWRNTWDEVINLYSLVSQGAVLKADDKDNYVPGRRTAHSKN